jgi:hypothetical protein
VRNLIGKVRARRCWRARSGRDRRVCGHWREVRSFGACVRVRACVSVPLCTGERGLQVRHVQLQPRALRAGCYVQPLCPRLPRGASHAPLQQQRNGLAHEIPGCRRRSSTPGSARPLASASSTTRWAAGRHVRLCAWWNASLTQRGWPLSRQVIRHKIAEMASRVEATHALIEQVAFSMDKVRRHRAAAIRMACVLTTAPRPPTAEPAQRGARRAHRAAQGAARPPARPPAAPCRAAQRPA